MQVELAFTSGDDEINAALFWGHLIVADKAVGMI